MAERPGMDWHERTVSLTIRVRPRRPEGFFVSCFISRVEP